MDALKHHTLLDNKHLLTNIAIPLTHRGKPIFYATNYGLIVEAVENDKKVWLTILCDNSNEHIKNISRRVHNISCYPLMLPTRLLRSALNIIREDGSLGHLSVLVQSAATPIDQFIQQNCSQKRVKHIRNALQSLAYHCNIFSKKDIHGGLTRQNICFDEKDELVLANYATVHLQPQYNDSMALAEAAIMLFVAACSNDTYKLMASTKLTLAEHYKRKEYILAAAEYYGVDGLVNLLRGCNQNLDRSSIAQAIQQLANEPFRPMPLLKGIMGECCNQSFKSHAATDTTSADHADWTSQATYIDFKTCQYVAPASDLFVRFCKYNLWGYANRRGKVLPTNKPLLAAYDFYEGRAVVRTKQGYGLIDSKGNWVMPDIWEDMVWIGEANIATAREKSSKLWHIYNRSGRRLSSLGAESFGMASEGYIVARMGQKYGYFSVETGQKMIDFIYDKAGPFCNGYAWVTFRGRQYHIDTSFHQVTAHTEWLISEGKFGIV